MKPVRATAALLALLAVASAAYGKPPSESFWGAEEHFTQRGHLRYLLLVPPHYDPSRRYELWVNLHGHPGTAGHAIYQYRLEAAQRGVFLLAPQADGDGENPFIGPDGRQDVYRFWDMKRGPGDVMTILEEVERRYPIDRTRVALLGFSAGCELGWRLLARSPGTFCFFGGVANGFRRGRVPGGEAGLRRAARRVPHFYGAGQDDGFAGPLFRPTARKLRQLGFALRTAYPPGVGHDLPPSIKTPLLAYLDRVRARLAPRAAGHRAHPRSTEVPR